MNYDMHTMTKDQIIHKFTEINYYMKQNCPDLFNTKDFGQFIIGLREVDKDTFDKNKMELLNLMMFSNSFNQTKLS